MVDKYHIKNISDIASIPEDKLDVFFSDLKEWLKIENKILKQWPDGEVTTESMVWVDDGVPGLSGLTITERVKKW